MDAPVYLSHAVTRHVRVSAQKSRLVAAQIRDRLVGEALTILRFTPKQKPALIIEKTLRSAIANAQQKSPGLDVDSLVVGDIHIDQGLCWALAMADRSVFSMIRAPPGSGSGRRPWAGPTGSSSVPAMSTST
jgi:large subunit ribosomal protein L22